MLYVLFALGLSLAILDEKSGLTLDWGCAELVVQLPQQVFALNPITTDTFFSARARFLPFHYTPIKHALAHATSLYRSLLSPIPLRHIY